MIPVFIGGCDRSGTTLLGHLLSRLRGAVTTPESPFKFRALAACESDPRAAPGAVETVLGHWRLALWGLPNAVLASLRDPMCAAPSMGQALFLLVRAHARERGVEEPACWVDHTPTNLLYAPLLARTWPQARFLHIVRDPRAVFASVQPLDWGPRTATQGARWWLGRTAPGLLAELELPERTLRIRYEDLLKQPEASLRRVEALVGLPLETPPTEGAARSLVLPAYTARQHALALSPPDPSRAEAWRQSLSPREVELIESVVEETIVLLRYERLFPAARPPTAREALRDHFRDFLHEAVLQKVRFARRRRRSLRALRPGRA